MASGKLYTKEEIEFVKVNYQNHTIKEIAVMMCRSYGGIKTLSQRLGLKKDLRHIWTETEMNYLKKYYAETPSKNIAETLNLPLHVVHNKAYNLGLHKSDEHLQKTWQKLSKDLQQSGKSHRFEKGGVAWNKGKKGLHFPGSEKGHFKKGHRPSNSSNIGDIAEIKGGYLKIKIAEPNQWKLLSHHVWEKHNGKPVPKGFVIRFIDGNIKNCAVENLELISQKENRLRNSIHSLYPAELKETIFALGALKRKINSKEKKKYAKK